MRVNQHLRLVPHPGLSPRRKRRAWHAPHLHADPLNAGSTQEVQVDNQVLLKPEQVAIALSVSRTVVYGLMRSGELSSVRVGRSRRITPQAIADFVQALHGGVC